MEQKKKILITGTAGFIGFHLTKKLQQVGGYEIVGLDSINDYYDISLKYGRLKELGFQMEDIQDGQVVKSSQGSRFIKLNLENKERLDELFQEEQFDYVVNLAAQAGVRYSLENPYAYLQSNIDGFMNILEACRHNKIKHLLYASSSSVYGLNEDQPFSVGDNVDHPISLYAATKKSNELMAHTYSYLFGLPTTGLRFFTVYGPWGRPDMALFIFTSRIVKGEPIQVFNHGKMKRDFTYVADIVEGISRLVPKVPDGHKDFDRSNPDPSMSVAPYRLYNIGNNKPVELMDFVRAIEDALDRKAEIDYQPLQPGDVPKTYADVESLFADIDFRPNTSIQDGINRFVAWYKDYYRVS